MIKVYSDVTKKYYDGVREAEQAEKEYEAEKSEAAEIRKKMAKDVEEKRKVYEEAKTAYYSSLKAFCDKYGNYHMTLGKEDWERLLSDFLLF